MSSSESSTKPSPKTVIADARRIAEQRAAKTQPREVVEDRFQALTSTNVFAQIMLNPALSPEAKQEALVKVLTFSKDSTKVENRAKLEAFGVFKEYLQEQRKLLNREGIKLQDTEAFAELQSVIDEMTKSSIEFQDRVKPLLEVLNAVFEIRKHDKITDVYREIQSDKAWQEEQAKVLAQLQEELGEQNRTLDALDREKARLAVDRTLFGLGVVRKSSRERIAMIDGVERVAVSKEISETIAKIQAQMTALEGGRNSDNPELVQQKEVLRQFLDLTKEENRERQKMLIDSAVRYVDTSDQRLKSVLSTLERLGKHAEVVADANGMLPNVHLIMDDSLKQVSRANSAVKTQLEAASAEESAIARMMREEKLNDANEHITRKYRTKPSRSYSCTNTQALPKMAHQYLALVALTHKPATCENYANSLRDFYRFLAAHRITLTTLSRQDMQQWFLEQAARGLGPVSRAARLIICRSYFDWLSRLANFALSDPAAVGTNPILAAHIAAYGAVAAAAMLSM